MRLAFLVFACLSALSTPTTGHELATVTFTGTELTLPELSTPATVEWTYNASAGTSAWHFEAFDTTIDTWITLLAVDDDATCTHPPVPTAPHKLTIVNSTGVALDLPDAALPATIDWTYDAYTALVNPTTTNSAWNFEAYETSTGRWITLLAVVDNTTCTRPAMECLPGEYQNASVCALCPAGTFATAPGLDLGACSPCPAGTFSTTAGLTAASACSPCPQGTYSPATGQASSDTCTSCPAGTYSGTAGLGSADACTPCPAGTFSGETGQLTVFTCTHCPAGKYSSAVGQVSLAWWSYPICSLPFHRCRK